MTTKKKTAGKGRARKLKLNKETLKDLDAKGRTSKVKGGAKLLGGPATDVACSRGACGPTWGATCTCGCQDTDISCAGGLCYNRI